MKQEAKFFPCYMIAHRLLNYLPGQIIAVTASYSYITRYYIKRHD